MTRPEAATTLDPRACRGRRLASALAIAAAGVAFALPATASAQSSDGANYVTTTTPSTRSLDVSGIKPICMKDVPHIQYTIVPLGFAPATISGSLSVLDVHGNVLATHPLGSAPVHGVRGSLVSQTPGALSGSIIFPGAAADAQGNGTQWPGWIQAPDGSWQHDPNNDILKGLSVVATLDPGDGGSSLTATARVAYPADTVCAGPQGATRPGSGNSGGSLPDTGGSIAAPLGVGGISIAAGLVALATARRRRSSSLAV